MYEFERDLDLVLPVPSSCPEVGGEEPIWTEEAEGPGLEVDLLVWNQSLAPPNIFSVKDCRRPGVDPRLPSSLMVGVSFP